MNIPEIIKSNSKTKAIQILKGNIRAKLLVDRNWIERAILVLFERQTSDEKSSEETNHNNFVGFNKSDAARLSFVAKFLLNGGRLKPEKAVQVYGPKVAKYAAQLARVVYEKNLNQAA